MSNRSDNSFSAQGYVGDDRNEEVKIYVNGEYFSRSEAKVSIFDAGFVLGDGVWEGLRVVDRRVISLEEHLNRLYSGAKTIQLDIGLSVDQMKDAIKETLLTNNMSDGVHIRLMVTRGYKTTPNQDPRFAIGKPTIVIVAEYKKPNPVSKQRGLKLLTSTIRCSTPDVFDLRLNSHSRLNFIQALIQAINSGADEALMLDPHGFVASCNSTNFFIVRDGELWTSTGKYNFKGITHKKVMKVFRESGGIVREVDYTLAETYTASEAFVTGTLGGVTPVTIIDGRHIGAGTPGPITERVSQLYQDAISKSSPENYPIFEK